MAFSTQGPCTSFWMGGAEQLGQLDLKFSQLLTVYLQNGKNTIKTQKLGLFIKKYCKSPNLNPPSTVCTYSYCWWLVPGITVGSSTGHWLLPLTRPDVIFSSGLCFSNFWISHQYIRYWHHSNIKSRPEDWLYPMIFWRSEVTEKVSSWWRDAWNAIIPSRVYTPSMVKLISI